MDTEGIAKQIRAYTNGYPYLVSRICQLIDTKVCREMPPKRAWTGTGVNEAVRMLLSESSTLFWPLTTELERYPELKEAIRGILMEGTKITWNAQQDAIVQMQMYGLIRNDNNTVRISNRIFEAMLCNLFLSDEELKGNALRTEHLHNPLFPG